jgi:hypothetical protein
MRFFLSTAVVLAAAAGVAAHVAAHGSGPHRGRMELIASVNHAVSVTASPVTGLYPGAPPTSLQLKIKNTYTYPIRVTSVAAKVAAATSRPGCTGAPQNLSVPPVTGGVRINPKRSRPFVMTVVMPKTVADACQGATFTITFTAHAVRG